MVSIDPEPKGSLVALTASSLDGGHPLGHNLRNAAFRCLTSTLRLFQVTQRAVILLCVGF
jgi:hypothetical protein